MSADTITAPIITSAADWHRFWVKLLHEYDAICIAQAQQDPGTVSCHGCFTVVPWDDTVDGLCQSCLRREYEEESTR